MAVLVLSESLAVEKQSVFNASTAKSILNPFGSIRILGRSSMFRKLTACIVLVGTQQAGADDMSTFYMQVRSNVRLNGQWNLGFACAIKCSIDRKFCAARARSRPKAN